MILVKTSSKDIVITGHALYDDYGRDIVCASVSSIVITSINAVMKLNDKAIKYEQNKDELIITILKKDKITMVIIDNMLDLLKELSNQYEKNIKVIGG